MRVFLATAFALLFVCAGTAQALDYHFEVTTQTDGNGSPCIATTSPGPPADPSCTLREAIAGANGLGGGGTVDVPPGTYVLTFGQLSVTHAMTIVGNSGARVTKISANHASRVFSIANPSASSSVRLEGLTIADGSTATGEHGAGVFFTGGNSLELLMSSIVDNETGSNGRGGGIFLGVGGSLSFNRSTVARNTAALGGGGLYVEGNDSGHSTATVFDSTFANNSALAGSAVYVARGTAADSNVVSFDKATIARNATTSGAMLEAEAVPSREPGTINLESSIVANPDSGATCGGGGTFSDGGSNLESADPGTCNLSGLKGSVIGADPKLGPLEDNGGPTDTMALGNGSAAIDSGEGSADQRTLPTSGPTGDIGAYEAQQQANLSIAGSDSPDPVAAGDAVTYTLTVASASYPRDAAQPRVQDTIPAGTELVSAVPSQGTCTGTTTVLCGLGHLDSGAGATVAITLRPLSPGSLSNTATVSSPRFDASSADDSVTLGTTVGPAVSTATPGAGGTGASGADLSPPGLTALVLSPSTFPAADSGPSLAAAKGTTVRYSLSEPATVTFRVTTKNPGRKAGKRCVKPTRTNAAKRKCKRTVTLPGSFRHAGTAGTNRFRFTGRVGGRKLKPGRYRLVGTAKDATGNKSKAVSAAFRIVR